MELVVITSETILPREAEVLDRLLGLWPGKLHLRKPGAPAEALRELLSGIEPQYRRRIILHDHFGLVREFGLAGVHLNGRNPELPEFHVRHVSRSCHTLGEIAEAAGKLADETAWGYDYVFLSPVFDSISKSGYRQAFTEAELAEAHDRGIINRWVYALGGVDENSMRDAARMGFGGAAVMGALWKEYLKDHDMEALSAKLGRLAQAAAAV